MSLVDEVDERPNDVVDKGERISWLLWDAAIYMPRYQSAILKLIEAIWALPQLQRTEEQIRTGRFEEKIEIRRSLEAFTIIWSETVSRCWEMRYGPYPYYEWNDFQATASASAFNAHYLAAYPPYSHDSNELTAALRLMVFALEQDSRTRAQQPPPQWRGYRYMDTGRPTDYVQLLNTDVHGMVPYFEIAGHIIFGFVGNRNLSLLERLKSSGGNLWQRALSFSMKRWEFWKRRLQWTSGQDGLMERARADTRKLLQIMQEIEQQN